MRTIDKMILSSLVALGSMFLVPQTGNAVLVFNGVTYSLLVSPVGSVTAKTAEFTLTISGINGQNDSEANLSLGSGRSGVNAFALNGLPDLDSVVAPVGFGVLNPGGLSAAGCTDNGNFICFKAIPAPPNSPLLSANTILVYNFSVTAFEDYDWRDFDPSFKIDWVGTMNNYDLVSTEIHPDVAVPEPATMLLLGTSSLGLAFLKRRKANQVV